jgi:phenylalanyl-tRNA synthetase beta chain
LQEALVYTLRAEDELRRWFGHTQAGNLGVNNPLAADQSHLRPSLVPGLLDSLQLNRHRRTGASRFFETGRVFRERDGEIHELLGVGFVIYNDPDARTWLAEGEADFYTAKRICQDLLKLANVEALDGHFRPLAEETPWQPGHAARVGEFLDKGYEAKCGILNVKLTRHWDLPGSVVAGHLLFAPASLAGAQKAPRAETISQFPAATRDLALLVEASSLAADVAADLENAAKKQVSGRDFELESVEVFDVYTGEGVPEGKKSLAFALTFRSPERTLKDKEVNEVFAAIQKESTASGHYQLRA